MKDTVFSIGLNVGDKESAHQLASTFSAAGAMFAEYDARIGRAQWEGVPERFVQIRVPAAGMSRAAGWYARYFAVVLEQSAVAIWQEGCTHWTLVNASGASTAGGSIAEFPVLFNAPARVNVPGALDTVGHSSVQAWSAGAVFPAVIARLERDGEYAGHELTIGAWSETYSSYDDAYKVAAYVCRNGRIDPARYAEVCNG